MKFLGSITNPKDLVNKEYVDNQFSSGGYTLPQATSDVLGGVKIGYPESGKNYPVELNGSGQMFVNVPWTDTTYSSLKNPNALTVKANGTSLGTYDGSSAKTFDITPANIGAALASHSHDYLPLTGGTLTGDVTLKNNIRILGTATDGTARQILRYNASNNLVLGYDNYTNSDGNTNLYGEEVNIYTRDAVFITSPTAGITERPYGVNKVLWSGNNQMGPDQTITLSEAVSAQPHGIVLVFGYNVANSSQNWNHVFVPKAHTMGGGVDCLIASNGTIYHKYCYVSNTTVRGYTKNNNTAASFNGSTVDMTYLTLKYVIGV